MSLIHRRTNKNDCLLNASVLVKSSVWCGWKKSGWEKRAYVRYGVRRPTNKQWSILQSQREREGYFCDVSNFDDQQQKCVQCSNCLYCSWGKIKKTPNTWCRRWVEGVVSKRIFHILFFIYSMSSIGNSHLYTMFFVELLEVELVELLQRTMSSHYPIKCIPFPYSYRNYFHFI